MTPGARVITLQQRENESRVNSLRGLVESLLKWFDAVALAIVNAIGRLTARRTVQVIEENGALAIRTGRKGSTDRIVLAEDGTLGAVPDRAVAALRGSRAELMLQPGRFVFRPLELPKRASEFLDGIVRSQIDRLTPWAPNDAVFGWGRPEEAGADRIVLTVAATARTVVTPYVRALTSLGVESIAVSTLLPGPEPVPVRVLDAKGRTAVSHRTVRHALVAVFLIAGLGAAVAAGAATVLGARLEAEQDRLARQIAAKRGAALAGAAALDPATAALRMLERRKHDNPSGVMVLEQLSKVLPDHTYVTELRIEGDKLRLVGITRDAPALIGLIERTRHFTHATFFAPTTRAPTDAGERFHIEAQIDPSFAPRS
jgi:general secretion pathway protein L